MGTTNSFSACSAIILDVSMSILVNLMTFRINSLLLTELMNSLMAFAINAHESALGYANIPDEIAGIDIDFSLLAFAFCKL